jgi:SAM-dependent methyltransferase
MDVKQTVREGYGKIAQATDDRYVTPSKTVGYGEADLAAVPEGTPSFGCGNPTALAGLRPGETVLDLGSGAGFDCFLAARAVGPTGHVTGVDMTPEMLARAKDNAARAGQDNVEFRRGDIENLPVGSASVDVVISNCVINLTPNKGKVFAEAYRVLRPGGRLHVSDLVLTGEPPDWLRDDTTALVGCVAGASRQEEYLALITAAGFTGLAVDEDQDATGWLSGALERENACGCCGSEALSLPDGLVHSLTVTAHKPGG